MGGGGVWRVTQSGIKVRTDRDSKTDGGGGIRPSVNPPQAAPALQTNVKQLAAPDGLSRVWERERGRSQPSLLC